MSLSGSAAPGAATAQAYTRLGYNVVFGIGVACQALALILILFVNTGRGRRNQEEYMREVEEKQQQGTTQPLLGKQMGPVGSINAE